MSRTIARIAVSTPYAEGSILAIARSAAAQGTLETLYTAFHTRDLLAAGAHIRSPTLKRILADHFGHRTFTDIPRDRIKSEAGLGEIVSAVLRRLPRMQGPATRAMYAGKDRFDRRVAREVDGSWDAIFTMFGSAEFTLAKAKDAGKTGVLNFVNSHPRYHNRWLSEFAAVGADHHELIPSNVERRVENELELAKAVLVPSQFVARQLDESGVRRTKVIVIPYGVNLAAFRPRSDEGRRADESDMSCLYVGQISHRKGVHVLLDAARLLCGMAVTFQLVGPLVSPEVLDALPENVRWVGRTPHQGVAEAMRAADVFVLPSLEDAYGLVVVEAMASGLPVVVTEQVGASEAIRQGREGFIVPAGDPMALAGAIRRLAESEELRGRMGRTGRETAERRHSWADYGNRVLAAVSRMT